MKEVTIFDHTFCLGNAVKTYSGKSSHHKADVNEKWNLLTKREKG